MDIKEFKRQGYLAIDNIVAYYENLHKYPALSQVKPGFLQGQLPSEPPQESESIDKIVSDLFNIILPGITHWQSPYFFGYYPSSSSFASILGDLYCTMFNSVGFNWICSPSATELETLVLDWLAKMIHLPDKFLSSGSGGGVVQGTASEAILVCLIAARERRRVNVEKMVVYCSDQTHSCLAKACKILGLKLNIVDSDETFRMTGANLEANVHGDIEAGLCPIFVCSTIGTTGTSSVDQIAEIGTISRKHNMWHHVDAAYAGAAMICPEFQYLCNGLETADSFNMNCHKWMLTNFEFGVLWVAKRKLLIDALNVSPSYLKNKGTDQGAIDYRDWQIPLGTRFRSLKFWFVVRNHGITGLQKYIRKTISLAKFLYKLLSRDARFHVIQEPTFSLICFRLSHSTDETNKKLENAIQKDGKYFVSHTDLRNIGYVIRIAIGSALTEQHHVQQLFDDICRAVVDLAVECPVKIR